MIIKKLTITITKMILITRISLLPRPVLDLGPMYVTNRRQTASLLNAPPIRGGGIIIPTNTRQSLG